MESTQHLWLSALLVFGIIVLPGMDMAFVLASSLADGTRAGFAAVAGMVIGGFFHVLASALGISLLLQAWPALFNALLLGGGLYVAWMGWQLWRGAGAMEAVQAGVSRPLPAIFGRAVATCLMNPKAYLFCLAVVPQFIRPELGPIALQGFVLFVIGALAQVLVYGGMALAAGRVRSWLAASAGAQIATGRLVGALLMATAVWTLASGWR
ncbi:LysE family translocator [Pelomonas sp. HMWF004]|nr:LysE family translocator [Pelomonas sp. HMWF004]